MEKVRGMETEKSKFEQESGELNDLIAQKKQESEREQRRKERLEADVKDLKQQLEAKQSDIRGKQVQLTYVLICKCVCVAPLRFCIRGANVTWLRLAGKHKSASRSSSFS